jgi:hypothetical protein
MFFLYRDYISNLTYHIHIVLAKTHAHITQSMFVKIFYSKVTENNITNEANCEVYALPDSQKLPV